MAQIRFSNSDFHQLREFLSREFGLFFEEGKATYLQNRVTPFFSEMNCLDMNHFISEIQANPQKKVEFLSAVTTNETWFFRHPRHFDILREYVLPLIIKSREASSPKVISIWSAGCSIGAEIFSIAITLLEVLENLDEWRIQLVASDISAKAIERARCGVYSTEELKLLSRVFLNKYFTSESEGFFRIKPAVLSLVQFERLNLLEKWPQRVFDIIFCRNTMIYFRAETKQALTARFYRSLSPGGVFFTSATETLHSEDENDFERLFVHGEYVYQKKSNIIRFLMYRFKLPSELLKALNLLSKSGIEYHITSIDQSHPLAPRKAIYIPESARSSVERVFSESSLSGFKVEEIKR